MAQTPRPARSPRRWLRITLLTLLTGLIFGAMLLVGIWTRACAGGACPSLSGLTNYDPDQASKVYAADGRLITDFGLQRRTVVSLAEMSPAVPAAFLAVEDKRFYTHEGVDWIRVGGALKSLFTGQRLHGFSTITMQLAGNLWPESINRRERTLQRKVREIKMAYEIERAYSKDRILELYLNQIDLGNRAFGVEAAAQRYFGKSVRDLNVAEAAMLAAMPKAPTRYNPRRNPDLAVLRRNVVITLLQDAGKLSAASADAWKAYPLLLSPFSDFTGVADYAVEYVRQQLDARFGADLYRAGFRIYTTIDLDMQLAAERTLDAQLEAIESGQLGRYPRPTYRQYLAQRVDLGETGDPPVRSPYLQGALVTMEAATGYVRAMVGGRDFEDSKFNRATQALRQAGSTFKPFVYSAAIRAGYPLSTVIVDEPLSIPMSGRSNWEPQNYDNTFQGPMTLRQALYTSRNTIAVKLGMELGPDAVVAEATSYGLTTALPAVPSISLGSTDVYLLEMVAAYTAFANLGVRVQPQVVLRVEDQAGRILWQPAPERVTVMDSTQAWIILDALRDVVRRGTARGAVQGLGFTGPAGGKTGTTNDAKDVWYIGFTPDLVTGVWLGLDRPTKVMGNAQGGRLAAPVWTAMMQQVYDRRRPPPAWERPTGLIVEQIDTQSGQRATPRCPARQVMVEYFLPGTEPEAFCPLHGGWAP